MCYWVDTYLVLRKDGLLLFYKDITETEGANGGSFANDSITSLSTDNAKYDAVPSNALLLGDDCEISEVKLITITSKKYSFQLEKRGSRSFVFCVDDEQQMREWITCMDECIIKRKINGVKPINENVGSIKENNANNESNSNGKNNAC